MSRPLEVWRSVRRPLWRTLLAALLVCAGLLVCAWLFRPTIPADPREYPPEAVAEAEQLRHSLPDPDNPPVLVREVDYSEGETASWYPQGESPLLAELVDEGKLPPVEVRTGPEPIVMEGPDAIGTYGGTLATTTSRASGFDSIEHFYSYAGLVRWSPQGYPIVPHIAKSWEINDDYTEFTFKLREGIRWSDGHPFTADDIEYVYQYEVIDDAVLGGRDFYGGVLNHAGEMGRIEKVDSYTVKFLFNRPNAIFLEKLATGSGRHLVNGPKHYLEQYHPRHGDKEKIQELMEALKVPSPTTLYQRLKRPDNPESPRMWPFIYRTHQPNPPFEFVRNPYYYAVDPEGNQLPYFDRMMFILRARELLAVSIVNGDVTVQSRDLPFDQYTLLMANREKGDYRILHWYPARRSDLVLFPNMNKVGPEGDQTAVWKRKLFDDKRFRWALSLAIDRPTIIDAALSGVGEAAQAAPGPESPFYEPALYKAFVDYDPIRANDLLDELGLTQRDSEGFRTFPDGTRMQFFIISTAYFDPKILEMVIEDWEEVGVRATLLVRSARLRGASVGSLTHDFAVYVSQSEYYGLLMPGMFIGGDNAWSYVRWYRLGGLYDDPRLKTANVQTPPADHPLRKAMETFDKAITAVDREELERNFRDVLKIAAENLWTISVATAPPVVVAAKNDVHNLPEVAVSSFTFQTPGNAGQELWFTDNPRMSPGAIANTQRQMLETVSLARTASVNGGSAASSAGKGGRALRLLITVTVWGSLIVAILLAALRHPFVARRLVIMVPTLAIISVLAFTIIQLPPGDYLATKIENLRQIGDDISYQQIEEFRETFYLDRPVIEQYARWLGLRWFLTFDGGDRGLLQGFLGRSMETQRPVNEQVGDRIVLTVSISLGTILLTWILAIPIGIYSAVRQYSVSDYIATFLGFIGMCVPDFLLAIILMYVSAEFLGLSVSGLFSAEYAGQPEWTWGKFLDLLEHIWVPILILGVGGTASMIRIMRANLLDELKRPYVVTARAKGVRPIKLLLKYPVRLALNPFISGIGYIFPHLVSGGAITAIILSLPTIGPLMLDAFRSEDMYLAGSMLMILSLLGVFGTLVSDLLLLVLDPRIRMEGKGTR